MNKLITKIAPLCLALSFFASSASALECKGVTLPDSLAVALLNTKVAGVSYKISDRKKLIIRKVESISGTGCNFRAKVSVKLERKLRRDAVGTVTLGGTLKTSGSKVCIANAYVHDVDLSNTLGIGESVYKWVANKVLPANMCF